MPRKTSEKTWKSFTALSEKEVKVEANLQMAGPLLMCPSKQTEPLRKCQSYIGSRHLKQTNKQTK